MKFGRSSSVFADIPTCRWRWDSAFPNRRKLTDICRQADGAVVGSALVRCIEENLKNPRLAEKVGEFTRWLRGGI